MSVSTARVSWMALALLTTMSSVPNAATVLSIATLTDASSRTSTTRGSALPPACSMSAAALWMVPGSFGCGASVLAAIAMLAPSRAAASAIASPMPREAPVTNRVFPARPAIGLVPVDDASAGERRLRLVHAAGALGHRAFEPAGRDREVLGEESRNGDPRRRIRAAVAARPDRQRVLGE